MIFVVYTLQAIVEKKQVSFEAAVEKLLNYRPDESDASDLEVLNVYEEIRDGRLRYPMTLLAYAGYHDQTDMINYLITKGASKYSPPNSISTVS